MRTARLKDIKIGDFKDGCSIQKPAYTDDGQGGQTVSWPEVCAPFIKLSPWKGHKSPFGDQNRATVTHTIEMIYQPGIDTTMRVIMGTRSFNIKSVIDIEEEHEFLQLMVEEGEPT